MSLDDAAAAVEAESYGVLHPDDEEDAFRDAS